MYLSTTQYGDKQLHSEKPTKKALLDKWEMVSGKPIFRDTKEGTKQTGYVLTQRGCYALWVEVFELKPVNYIGA